MVAPMMGSDGVYFWRKYEVWSQAVGFMLMRFVGI
jgi:hypothetical protein